MEKEEIFREFEKEKGFNPTTTSDCELTNWLVNKLIEERKKNILTERKYFTGLAMQGMISRDNASSGFSEDVAKQCVFIADELLKQLEL